jgi:glycosyltransferase involved in cell wall biosynthesis
VKILLVNTYDISGGAAIAAYRLDSGLRQIGNESLMLVQHKVSDDESVHTLRTKGERFFSFTCSFFDLAPLLFYKNRDHTPWSLGWFPHGIAKKIDALHPDVVHLHWIGNGFVPISEVRKIWQPLVWTLHDMWAFTGGCHYAGDCKHYTVSCGMCPQLKSTSSHDVSSWIWKKKNKLWKNCNITIVAPSRWLAVCARQSSLFSELPIEVIPNGIDTTVFKPTPKKIARDILNLPQDKKLILFGAMNSLSDKRKGYSYLEQGLESLHQIDPDTNYELLIFGESPQQNAAIPVFPIHNLGIIPGDIALSLVYSAADVFVAPSIQENLANTVMESLACGSPVVAFNIGGMPDMIEHRKNGYLAQPFDYNDLAQGIFWVISENNCESSLSLNARTKVLKNFDQNKIAQKYELLYKTVLSKKN